MPPEPSPASAAAPDAFFVAEGELFHPTEPARGFWRPNSLQGVAVVALIGRQLGRADGVAGLIPARMTVDMHGMAPFGPVNVTTRTLRASGRLRLIEAILTIGGAEYARATGQFLRQGEPPEFEAGSPPPWDVPPPEAFPEHRSKWAMSDQRVITGEYGGPLPHQCWLRSVLGTVAGEAPSAWDQVARVADYASAWCHAGRKIGYINTDITTMLHRLPVDEWIGFETTGHESSHGIAVGHCRLHDRQGAIGHIAVTGITMTRKT